MDFYTKTGVGELVLETLALNEYTQQNLSEPALIKAQIENHLRAADLAPSIPDFPLGLEWFNTSKSISLEDLKGRVTVLDFFTYCCINCMHILPDLEALEAQYPPSSGVLVVGVHSAKFENEKLSANILSAIERYSIHHPVVNDPEAFLWKAFSISCWPTLLILGPRVQPLFCLVGEGHRETLIRYVASTLDFYSRGEISPSTLLLQRNAHVNPSSSDLRFPGKIALLACGPQKLLAIADSGNNRILIASTSGQIKEIIGGEAGFTDDSFEKAEFRSPQGLVWRSSSELYVADTGNHAIRLIDFTERRVTTVVGTGTQGGDREGGLSGSQQVIASPWDVCFIPGLNSSNEQGGGRDILCIAMAGTHQIWGYFLRDMTWWKKSNYAKDVCVRLAGSGAEENRNNSYPHKAGFAQPSGITHAIVNGHSVAYIADSESSSIRQLSLGDGAVKVVVGGDKDPLNLFAFGDSDSSDGGPVRLQHPLGVSWHSKRQLLYLADSYNHRIKTVATLNKNVCAKLVGNGQAGIVDGLFTEAQFNEPGGLCVDEEDDVLYVADTNNHCVRILDLKTSVVRTLKLSKREEIEDCPDGIEIVHLPLQECEFAWEWTIVLPEGVKLNTDAPSTYKVITGSRTVTTSQLGTSRKIDALNGRISLNCLPVETKSNESISLQLQVYLCNKQNLCFFQKPVLSLQVQRESSIEATSFMHSSIIHVPNLL